MTNIKIMCIGKWYLGNSEFWDVGQNNDLGKLMALLRKLQMN